MFAGANVEKKNFCRSRKGAWIEIKFSLTVRATNIRRSRKGAWIEIRGLHAGRLEQRRRSRKGAWIEIQYQPYSAPPQRRSRKGAWIEMPKITSLRDSMLKVAPVRERGLKSLGPAFLTVTVKSLP